MKFSISPKLALLIITAMFVLPLVLAWLMYSGSLNFEPGSTRNLGMLVEPPLQINWQEVLAVQQQQDMDQPPGSGPDLLLEHWVILYPVPEPCESSCQQRAASLRQIHLAAGRHQSRVRLALMLGDTNPQESVALLHGIYPKFTLIRDPGGTLNNALVTVRGGALGEMTAKDRLATDSIYLIDPLGNIMMYYAAEADPNHIKQDLKRLLTWSKLDEQ